MFKDHLKTRNRSTLEAYVKAKSKENSSIQGRMDHSVSWLEWAKNQKAFRVHCHLFLQLSLFPEPHDLSSQCFLHIYLMAHNECPYVVALLYDLIHLAFVAINIVSGSNSLFKHLVHSRGNMWYEGLSLPMLWKVRFSKKAVWGE